MLTEAVQTETASDPPRPTPDRIGAQDLCVVLGRIVRRLRRGQEAGETTLSELSVLSRLDRCGPLPPGVLADRERVSPQAITEILAALERRRLVTRAPDERDGRRATLQVTPAGSDLLAGRRCRNAQRMARALAEDLTAAERDVLAEALPLLERLAERL